MVPCTCFSEPVISVDTVMSLDKRAVTLAFYICALIGPRVAFGSCTCGRSHVNLGEGAN